ncbi:MAG: PAS domain S-box protein [Defluviitaleaceae bacterium]|nr:PAS domain S-box protein [Defluviitaleaceae bacterium]
MKHPIQYMIFDEQLNIVESSPPSAAVFGDLGDKGGHFEAFLSTCPPFQPCGTSSREKLERSLADTFSEGSRSLEWVFLSDDEGGEVAGKMTLTPVVLGDKPFVIAHNQAQDQKTPEDILNTETNQLMQHIVETSPLPCVVFDDNLQVLKVNRAALQMHDLPNEKAYQELFFEFSEPIQPCGTPADVKLAESFADIFANGKGKLEWMHRNRHTGEPIPVEVTAEVVQIGDKPRALIYDRDLRDFYKLKESEERVRNRLKTIMDASPLVCCVYDSEGNILEVSRTGTELFGYDFSDSTFDDFYGVFLDGKEERRAASKEIVEGIIAANQKVVVPERILRHKDGTLIPCEITAIPVVLDGKDHVITFTKDLRDEYKLREVHEQARMRLEAILDTSPLLCSVYNQQAVPIYNSKSGLEFYGFKDEADLAENYNKIFPEFQPDGTNTSEFATKKIIEVANTKEKSVEFITLQTVLGEPIPCEITLSPIDFNGELHVLACTRDLREQHKLKEMHAKNHEWMMAILDSSPFMCAVYNEDYECVEVNQAAANLFGLPYPRMFCERLDLLMPEFQPCGTNSHEKMIEVLKLAIDHGSHSLEWMYQNLDGSPIPCEVYLTPVTIHDRTFVIEYTNDMREQKAMLNALQNAFEKTLVAEAAERSNKAKSRFLARMSHEIRTPLTAILGISEMHLQGQNLPPQLEKSFIKIHNSSNLLLGIINDLLDFSKIESGKMELSNHEYCVETLIASVAHMHTVYIGSKGIKFIINVDENLPTNLIGDSLRVEQIAINLLSNAFKYTEEGTVELQVDFEPDDCDDCIILIITVKDTGVGMTEEQLNDIYEEYARFYKHDTHIVSGTGLGMPIVATLAQLMNAHVGVESQYRVGTQASVRIPQKVYGTGVLGEKAVKRLQRFETTSVSNVEQFKLPREPMPYGRVLVVDDVDANLYVARGLLAFYDLQIETCESGYAAVEKVRDGNVYDIIFMDHMMPGMDGIQTLGVLHEMGYTAPIVALTANALIGQSEEFIREGFDEFLSKPISRKNLHSVLLKFVRDKQPAHVIEAARAEINGKNRNEFDPQNGSGLQNKLRSDFAKKQGNAFAELTNFIETGDFKSAHLLAHSLKGLAGLMYESDLAQAAAKLEQSLSKGTAPDAHDITKFEDELALVLKDIGDVKSQTEKDVSTVLSELQGLLQQRKSSAADMLEPLRQIPEAAILVHQVEKFDFKAALASVAALQDIL